MSVFSKTIIKMWLCDFKMLYVAINTAWLLSIWNAVMWPWMGDVRTSNPGYKYPAGTEGLLEFWIVSKQLVISWELPVMPQVGYLIHLYWMYVNTISYTLTKCINLKHLAISAFEMLWFLKWQDPVQILVSN